MKPVTFTVRAGVTTCDKCGQTITGTGWKPKAEHAAFHAMPRRHTLGEQR